MAVTPRAEGASDRTPVRTCVGCRRRRPQRDLVRIVRTGDGRLAVGRTLPGRGAWLCRDRPTCFDEAIRRGGFARAFRTGVDRSAVEAIRDAPALRGIAEPIDFVPGHRPARD